MRESQTDAGSSMHDKAQVKASLWRTVRMVGWSFLGIRKKSAYEDDVVQLNPIHLIIVGLLAALSFIGALLVIVRWVVAA